jgi:flotillin
MSPQVQLLLFIIGCAVAMIVLLGTAVKQFYRRCSADEALVRTGSGGVRVYIGEGAFVMPVLHQLMRVSLKSIKLMVDRSGKQHALVTADKIKANVTTELYVKVEPLEESVRAAARSFGTNNLDQHVVADLIEGKLTDALRSSAANKTFNDLHTNRQAFADSIKKTLADELKHNGLILENVSITSFAMLPVTQLDPNDVFDAEGMRTITETVQLNLERTNLIKTEKANQIEAQNVISTKKSLALKQEQAYAEADQSRQIAEYAAKQTAETAQAVYIQQQAKELAELEKDRMVSLARIEQQRALQEADLQRQAKVASAEAAKKRTEKEAQIASEKAQQAAEIAKQREIETATIEKQKAVQTAEVDRQKVLEAANIARQKVIEAANIEKQQVVETANIAKQIAVLKSEEEAARAGAAKAVATAEEEAATQNIVTVEETAKANREKQIALIKSEEEAQRSRIGADREAYKIRLEAETGAATKKAAADGEIAQARGIAEANRVEAEGRALAAAQDAQATITLAEAYLRKGQSEAESRRLQVEAENAVAMKFVLRDVALKALDVLPAVTRELMSPAQHISEIKILQMQGGLGSGGEASGQPGAMGVASPVLKTIMEAGAAYPLLRELMNFAQVDTNAVASKARSFLNTLPAELKAVIDRDPALASKLAQTAAPIVEVHAAPVETSIIAAPRT